MDALSTRCIISEHMMQNSVNTFEDHEMRRINAFASKM